MCFVFKAIWSATGGMSDHPTQTAVELIGFAIRTGQAQKGMCDLPVGFGAVPCCALQKRHSSL